jgi:hypothetical protein
MEEIGSDRGDLTRFTAPTVFIKGEGAGIDFSDLDPKGDRAEFAAKLSAKIGASFTYHGHKI